MLLLASGVWSIIVVWPCFMPPPSHGFSPCACYSLDMAYLCIPMACMLESW
jgi:hypothetical protein